MDKTFLQHVLSSLIIVLARVNHFIQYNILTILDQLHPHC